MWSIWSSRAMSDTGSRYVKPMVSRAMSDTGSRYVKPMVSRAMSDTGSRYVKPMVSRAMSDTGSRYVKPMVSRAMSDTGSRYVKPMVSRAMTDTGSRYVKPMVSRAMSDTGSRYVKPMGGEVFQEIWVEGITVPSIVQLCVSVPRAFLALVNPEILKPLEPLTMSLCSLGSMDSWTLGGSVSILSDADTARPAVSLGTFAQGYQEHQQSLDSASAVLFPWVWRQCGLH